MVVGNDIGLRIDHRLLHRTQQAMAYIEYEVMVFRVKPKKSVAYIDHNTLQTGLKMQHDHRFIHLL